MDNSPSIITENPSFGQSTPDRPVPGLSTCHISPREWTDSDIETYYQHQADVQEFRSNLARLAESYNPQGWEEPAHVEFYGGAGLAIARRSRAVLVDREPRAAGLPDGTKLVAGHLVDVDTGEIVEARAHKRGKIRGFSRKSRRRLLSTIAKIRRDAPLPLMITLTYPDEFPVDPERWKRDAQVFQKRLERAWKRPGVVWRLEVVDRKSGTNEGSLAPHYHLLVWGVPLSWIFKEWLSKAWYQVVGSGDDRHLRAGTNVQRIRSHRGMVRYLAKMVSQVIAGELAKETQAQAAGVGRWWGMWHKEAIPFGVRRVMELAEREACNLIRYFRRFAGIRSRSYRSLSCFLDVEQWSLKLGWTGSG